MDNMEKKISDYIDQLNKEVKPIEHNQFNESADYEELMDTVRTIRNLKEPEYPDENFSRRLAASVKGAANMNNKRNKYVWITRTVAAAAVVALVFLVNMFMPTNNGNIVNAMEKALKELKAYHGIIEVVELNGQGDKVLQGRREVWADRNGNYYLKELEGSMKGLVTVNNGDKKWQIREDTKQVHIFSAFPDAYRFTFELGKEIENIKNAVNVKVIGEENILGRETSKIEVTPDGGAVYYLWVDKETNLPLQRETAMENAVQYQITYTEIEYLDEIPSELLEYNIPEGFGEIDKNGEQVFENIQEAKEIIGFEPKLISQIPEGYSLKTIAVEMKNNRLNLYYKNGNNTVIITQMKADGELKPDTSAVLGKVNDNVAEIFVSLDNSEGILTGGGSYAGMTDISRVRWIENGKEYSALGDISLDEMKIFVEEISEGEMIIPEEEVDTNEPEVTVEVNMEIEESEQKSADAGHSPWRLDPAYVTQVFVSLLIMPDGIQGDYPIAYDSITIEENSGVYAVAKINDDNSPASYVYLKRLVREDSTGIWTVVGYDKTK